MSDAYALVVRWFVDRAATTAAGGDQDGAPAGTGSGDSSDATADGSDDGGDEHPVVFVTALGDGVSIDLDTQAGVVAAAKNVADVHFVDERSEALTDDGVIDDRLLLAIGALVGSGGTATIECVEIHSPTDEVRWVFELRARDGEWQLVSSTSPP